MMAQLKVTQTGSSIGTKPKQRGTLRALGLGRIGKSRVHTDTPDVRGQIQKVPHLVSVETLSAEEGD
jgi:large subunit ribosomal protein L30